MTDPDRRHAAQSDRRAVRRGGRRPYDRGKPWWRRRRLWLVAGTAMFWWWRRLRSKLPRAGAAPDL